MRNKSIKKIHVFPVVLSVALILGLAGHSRTEEPDPVLKYYWDNAAETARATNPSNTDVSYKITARTFCHRIGSGGSIASTDTVNCEYFYTGNRLDSLRAGEGKEACARKADLTIPHIFDNSYELSLFPNDTGGAGLAIGLTSDSTATGQPDGLLVIDRKSYVMKNLYLYYPDKEGYRRFTRSFRLIESQGFVFPDSVWEVGTKLGIFSSENYRTETGVTDIIILP